MTGENFEELYNTAAAQHPKGHVSVESFRGVLDEIQAQKIATKEHPLAVWPASAKNSIQKRTKYWGGGYKEKSLNQNIRKNDRFIKELKLLSIFPMNINIICTCISVWRNNGNLVETF